MIEVTPRDPFLEVVVEGEPQAQGRPRFAPRGRFVHAYDPATSVAWKRRAAAAMLASTASARRNYPTLWPTPIAFEAGPLCVILESVRSCPSRQERVRTPRPLRLDDGPGDTDNYAKAVLDAGTGVLWTDDCQVVVLRVAKFVAPQGAPAYVRLLVSRVELGPSTDVYAGHVYAGVEVDRS